MMKHHFSYGVASKDGSLPAGIPVDAQVFRSNLAPWAEGANKIIDDFASYGDHPFLCFLDDDITLLRHSFEDMFDQLSGADVWGPMLVYPQNRGGGIQSAGHVYTRIEGAELSPLTQFPNAVLWPQYVAHVSASCFLISKKVAQAGIRFPVWPGAHYEDVAFTLDCWLKGFKVGYWPTPVIHDCNDGVGNTKGGDSDFEEKRRTNLMRLHMYYKDIDLPARLKDGTVPIAARPIE